MRRWTGLLCLMRMATVVRCHPGDSCTVRVPLTPKTTAGLPFGFSCYGEWRHQDTPFTLKTDEAQGQHIERDAVYLVVNVPEEAPKGVYRASHFEMRVGHGTNRKTEVVDLSKYSVPEIDVQACRQENEIDWPTLTDSR